MVDLSKVMEREGLHSEHAAQCVLEARRRDNSQQIKSDPMTGFACVLRDELGREFLAMQTFGESKTKAKRAAMAMNSRRINDRKPALEMLRVCEVGVRVLDGQPPVDNRFVEDRCEQFPRL